jgi:hypothetical protein
MPYVHLKEAVGVAKKNGWDIPKLNSVLTEFAAAIRISNLIGIGVGVHMEAWRAIPKSMRNLIGDAHIFCCSRMVRRIMDRLETVGLNQEKLTIVFDQDFASAPKRLKLFAQLKQCYEPIRTRIAQVSFADMRTFYPLQAADMLAWETRRELINRSGGRESSTRWNELMTALPSGQIEFAVGEFWTKDWFDQELPKMAERAGIDWRRLP